MKTLWFAMVAAGLMVSALAAPPFQDRLLTDDTVRVSEHVQAIIGYPNVGIVVGRDAVLVVDTGLGKRNGAVIAKAVAKLAPGKRLYLTTTHFHPEHAAGVLGFPPGTILVRNRVQQEEMDQGGEAIIRLFAGRNDFFKSLLAGEQLRAPDILFDRDLRLDLGGGVAARLLWFGSAHTRGDQLVFVEPDRTLISGDVVQNKVGPNLFGNSGTAANWIATVEEVAKLGALHVLPDHSAIGDGSMVELERAFLVKLRSRALQLKGEGRGADDAGRQLTAEFKQQYPDWNIDDLSNFVKGAYAE